MGNPKFSSCGGVLLRVAPAEWHRGGQGPLGQTQLLLTKAGAGRGLRLEKGAALHLWARRSKEALPSRVCGCVFGLAKRLCCP